MKVIDIFFLKKLENVITEDYKFIDSERLSVGDQDLWDDNTRIKLIQKFVGDKSLLQTGTSEQYPDEVLYCLKQLESIEISSPTAVLKVNEYLISLRVQGCPIIIVERIDIVGTTYENEMAVNFALMTMTLDRVTHHDGIIESYAGRGIEYMPDQVKKSNAGDFLDSFNMDSNQLRQNGLQHFYSSYLVYQKNDELELLNDQLMIDYLSARGIVYTRIYS